jgi:hypothetical protein
MHNSAYEELVNPKSQSEIIDEAHSAILTKDLGIPTWLKELTCPYCKETLAATAIRSIGIKLNPRNVGDLFVEFLCMKCKMGNILYFKKEIRCMLDMCDLLIDKYPPQEKNPIIEEEMYKQKYHNTIESDMFSRCVGVKKETENGST